MNTALKQEVKDLDNAQEQVNNVGCWVWALGPVPRRIVNFNPGLSQVILSKDMQLKVINSVEPLLCDTVIMTQTVSLSNT